MEHFAAGGGQCCYIEELFESYLRDPNEVPEEWRNYFDKLLVDENSTVDTASPSGSFTISKNQRRAKPMMSAPVSSEHERKQMKVLQLINGRRRGHQHAKLILWP